eukprot:CAMPEP_0174261476 /NCGR_PEP_ID=MMETSP0439-20130205/11453_1 /TAXON_ID=0 /ORGANISM="Stereomyxa ramosa, Strain Chinc5" /LENGTH=308 /DNA_ID=CAMNT_0015345957 /DNA_START=20 /DNA_END=946 /DNA_ORIENTATION=+
MEESATTQKKLEVGSWVEETLVPGWRQQIQVEEVLYEDTSNVHQLAVFQSKSLGRVLVIEDRIQLTSKDEFTYHEMFAHVPITITGCCSKDEPGKVLIIGGGDGATLREVLKHKNVRVTLVDIDPKVIELSKGYLPTLHNGAFDDERASIIIDDGSKFVKETEEKFDIVLVDCTDPEPDGPSGVLISTPFYADCRSVLNPGGVIVTQNGHPQWESYPKVALTNLAASGFGLVTVYQFCVPTYLGGIQTFGFATQDPNCLANLSDQDWIDRWTKTGVSDVKHFTPLYGKASFVLPKWVQDNVDSAVNQS